MIKTYKGREIKFEHTQETRDHFNDPSSELPHILKDTYEFKVYDRWLNGRTDMVILDIGANIGITSLYCADSAKRIIAVEPTPSHCNVFKHLCKNESHIELVEAAITNKNEDVTFYILPENTAANSIIERSGPKLKVKGMTLETLLNDHTIDKVDWCKIDIEGSEMTALTLETLKPVYDKIDQIFLEVHATDNPWRESRNENVVKLFKILSEVGYVCESPLIDVKVTGENMEKIRQSCRYKQYISPVQMTIHDQDACQIFCSKKNN